MEIKEDIYYQELLSNFYKAKRVKGNFLVDPENLCKHFCELEDFNEDCSGIYFLMVKDYVTYVGMSKASIKDRIYGGGWSIGHIYDKVFSSFKFIDLGDMSKEDIRKIEYIYINMFNPPENSEGKCKLFEHYLDDKYIEESKLGQEAYKEFSMNKSVQAAEILKKYWETKC